MCVGVWFLRVFTYPGKMDSPEKLTGVAFCLFEEMSRFEQDLFVEMLKEFVGRFSPSCEAPSDAPLAI